MSVNGNTENDFSNGSVPKTITSLAIPMIIAQLVNVLYSMVDRIYIGKLPEVGRIALTGIGITFPIITIINAFANLFGMGGAPLCSIARGGRDLNRARRIMGNSFLMLVCAGVVLTIAGLIFADKLVLLFGASENTFVYAKDYISVYMCGSVFVMIGLGMNPFITSQGFAKFGMLTVAIGAVVNILLDPLFIFVFDMGVRGAALATIISQFMSAVWVLRFLTGKRAIITLTRDSMRPEAEIIKKTVALGLSKFTMNLTESAVQITCNRTALTYGGDIYVSVMTVINSIRQFIMMPLSGFSDGAQPFIGFNYGAGEYRRVRRGIMFVLCCCVCYSTLTCILVMTFTGNFITVFNSDPELVLKGIPSVRMFFCMFWMMCMQMTGQTCFVALGKAKQAVFFSLLRKAIIVIPLVLLLPGVFGLGIDGLFIAEPISDAIGSVACFSTFMLTVWRKLKNPPDDAAVKKEKS